MPDASDFDRDPNARWTPADWGDAFAALSTDIPAADGWQRLQARLPAATARTGVRRRWPVWLAAAASLALMIAIPVWMRSSATPPVPATAQADAPAVSAPERVAGVDPASEPVIPTPVESDRATPPATTPETVARARKPKRAPDPDPSQQPIRTAAQPADTTRLASADPVETPASASDAATSGPTLESLYAQSAQLESLLSMARDERVSSGTAAALADTLDTQIARIDAALSRSDVSPRQRSDLWLDRVDALRQLVGIETTQRLYSARGQQYEAALVSID